MLILALMLEVWLGWAGFPKGALINQPQEESAVRAFDDGTPPPPPRP